MRQIAPKSNTALSQFSTASTSAAIDWKTPEINWAACSTPCMARLMPCITFFSICAVRVSTLVVQSTTHSTMVASPLQMLCHRSEKKSPTWPTLETCPLLRGCMPTTRAATSSALVRISNDGIVRVGEVQPVTG